MSKFRTTIPVDLKSVIAKLPERSNVLSVEYNAASCEIELIWDNDKLTTPYTFPLDYPLEKLVNDKAASVNVKETVDKPGKRGKKTVEDA